MRGSSNVSYFDHALCPQLTLFLVRRDRYTKRIVYMFPTPRDQSSPQNRASQVTSSDKLLRLQFELLSSLDLAKNVLNREPVKREAAHQAQNVWEKRLSLVELKRKFPSLGVKEDEELLHDKERVPKRPRTDSASAYAFHSDIFRGVWMTDAVDGAASCPVSDSGVTVATWYHLLHMRKRLFVQRSGLP
jgi:hypothetical protein